jgi:hypothetical protein
MNAEESFAEIVVNRLYACMTHQFRTRLFVREK